MTTARELSPIGGSARASNVRYVVLVWLCLAAAVAYIQRTSLAVVQSSVQEDLGLSDRQMGWIYGLFFLTYGLFQIPSGLFGDRLGSRLALPILSSLWSFATVLTAGLGWAFISLHRQTKPLAAHWVIVAFVGMITARLLAGAAQAGVFPCSAVVVHRWFPKSQWAFATGWLSSFQHVGAMIATALTSLLIQWQIHWSSMFVLYSLPGFAWAALFYLWYRDRPEAHSQVNAAELAIIGSERDVSGNESTATVGSMPEPVPWRLLLTSWTMWAFCSQQFCRAAAYNFYGSFFPTFLQHTRGISLSKSALLTTIPVAATFLGTVLSGVISDWILARTGSRRLARQWLSAAGVSLAALLIFTAWFVKSPTAAVLVISAGSFCAAFAGPTSYALSIEMGGKHISTVFGAMNMSGSFGAFVFPVVVGYILGLTGNWNAVLLLFAGIYVAAAFFWLLFDPNGTVFDSKKEMRAPR